MGRDYSATFVYASIRGNRSIASYAVGNDGKLTLVERVSSGGTTPRDFDIDSTGLGAGVGRPTRCALA